MNIHTALKRLPKLSLSQLEQLLSSCENQLKTYKNAIRHYPPDRMEKYGTPFLKQLQQHCDTITQEIDSRSPKV